MYQPRHRLCLFCNRSVERIRRHTLTRDLQNEHQQIVQNIIRALTREVSTYILFSNRSYTALERLFVSYWIGDRFEFTMLLFPLLACYIVGYISNVFIIGFR